MGSVLPVRRSTPFGSSIKEPLAGLSLPAALHALARPFRDRQPRIREPRFVSAACAASPKLRSASSPGLWLPYGTLSAWWTRLVTADPSTVACHVRGLVTPFAAFTTRSCDPRRLSAPHASQHIEVLERPWASPFTGFPSTASGTSFEARALLPLPPAPALPRREGPRRAVAFRALFPRRVRAAPGPGGKPPSSDRRSRLEVRVLSRACSCSIWLPLWSWSLPSHPSVG
jgi:hypothetical protein